MLDAISVSLISAGIAGLSACISITAIVASRVTAQQLKEQDRAVDKKRFVTTLWDKMTDIKKLTLPDPKLSDDQRKQVMAVLEVNARQALNTLELVSICWLKDIVDHDMIVKVFGNNFLLRYKEIEDLPTLPVMQKNGSELLHQPDYTSIRTVAGEIDTIIKEHNNREIARRPH